MKKTYRIRKRVMSYIDRTTKLPVCYYFVEVLQFKFWFFESWKRITDFKPVFDDDVFNSIEEAKDTIKKYDTYHKQLAQDDSVVDTIEL